jgi:hypothetical protein
VSGGRALAAAVALGAAVRAPFWVQALRTPADGDLAVIGAMSRDPFASLTMWGQPYGAPLDAWLVRLCTSLFGESLLALRLPGFVLGLALIPLAWGLARRIAPAAALPAALLVALAPPYLLLLGASPPPFYALALALGGATLLLAVDAGERLDARAAARGRLWALGLCAGLGLWNHLMSASVVAAAAWRLRRHARAALPALLGLAIGAAPLAWRLAFDPAAGRPLAVSSRQQGPFANVAETLPQMHRPLLALLGAHAPLVADESAPLTRPPAPFAALFLLGWLAAVAAALRAQRGHEAARTLALAAGLALLAFPFPLRSGPHTIRFLTPLFLPLVALAAAGLARALPARAVALATALGLLQLPGAAALESAWRAADRAAPPFLLVDLGEVQARLEQRGLRHAYASYGPAWRLGWESGGRVTASQPWNERFRHHPLPFEGEVAWAQDVAWVLTPDVPTDLPAPREFEDALGQIGGTCRREEVGAAVVFSDCTPPFSPRVEPWPAGPLGDRDLAPAVTRRGDDPLTLELPSPRALDAVTLLGPATGPALPRGYDLRVSADGVTWQRVVRRRRGEERRDLAWSNGFPRYATDDRERAVALGGRPVRALRLEPQQGTGDWALAEILLHPATPPAEREPWAEWLPPAADAASRAAALTANPRPDRADYWSRLLLARR